jgi:broad specificity phosphatase PhoE
MHKIILIRHAESLANVDIDVHLDYPDHKIPLSNRGKLQALNLKLNYPMSVWYSSPYERALQTFDLFERPEYLGKFFDRNLVIYEPLVSERRIKDRWGKEHYEKIIEQWKIHGSFWWSGFDYAYESGNDVYQRAMIFLNRVTHRHFSDKNFGSIVVFTHGFFMQMMRIALIGDENIDLDAKRRNPDNAEQWIFRSWNGKNWQLEKEIKNTIAE